MARTTKAERKRRREAALVKISEGYGFADTVTFVMQEWGCSRSTARRDCHWAHDQLQLSIDSHDAQHLMVHMATSLQRISLKAEEDKQYAAAVGAQKMLSSFCCAGRWITKQPKQVVLVGVIATATPVLKLQRRNRFPRDVPASNV